MGLGIAYRFRGDFKVIIWGASHKGMEPFLWSGVDLLRQHVKVLIWQLEEDQVGGNG